MENNLLMLLGMLQLLGRGGGAIPNGPPLQYIKTHILAEYSRVEQLRIYYTLTFLINVARRLFRLRL